MSRWIDFENFPSTATPLSAENLNDLQDMIQAAIAESWKVVYPVGSIYISMNSNSPETLFGGRWEKLKDTFLLGQGDTYTTLGATGGAPSHTHTMAHTHTISHTHNLSDNGWAMINPSANGSALYFRVITTSSWTENGHSAISGKAITESGTSARAIPLRGTTNGTNTANSGAASTSTTSDVSNMPPYTVVYMWKRLPDNA